MTEMISGSAASGSLPAQRRRDGHIPCLAAQAKDQGLQVTKNCSLGDGLFRFLPACVSVSGDSSPTHVFPTQSTLHRLRRELSGKGKDAFLRGDHEASLQFYNEALLYSTGKGIAHTLAMVW